MRRTAAAVAIAAAIGGLGGAAIYAASGSAGAGPGRFGGGPPPNMGGMAAQAREHADPATVHSEVVLIDGNGGFTTTVTQIGAITALSPTSLTVRSGDGFTQSYTLPRHGDPAATPPFAVNDTVEVRATRDGATLTVNSLGVPAYPPAAP